jgi:hypothetical protein
MVDSPESAQLRSLRLSKRQPRSGHSQLSVVGYPTNRALADIRNERHQEAIPVGANGRSESNPVTRKSLRIENLAASREHSPFGMVLERRAVWRAPHSALDHQHQLKPRRAMAAFLFSIVGRRLPRVSGVPLRSNADTNCGGRHWPYLVVPAAHACLVAIPWPTRSADEVSNLRAVTRDSLLRVTMRLPPLDQLRMHRRLGTEGVTGALRPRPALRHLLFTVGERTSMIGFA